MSLAFEITEDDVRSVLVAAGKPFDEDKVSDLLLMIDTNAVEKSALRGDDMDEQTDYAHEAIRSQLEEMGYLTPSDGSSFSP